MNFYCDFARRYSRANKNWNLGNTQQISYISVIVLHRPIAHKANTLPHQEMFTTAKMDASQERHRSNREAAVISKEFRSPLKFRLPSWSVWFSAIRKFSESSSLPLLRVITCLCDRPRKQKFKISSAGSLITNLQANTFSKNEEDISRSAPENPNP